MHTKTWLIPSSVIVAVIAIYSFSGSPNKPERKHSNSQQDQNTRTITSQNKSQPVPDNEIPTTSPEINTANNKQAAEKFLEASKFNDRCLTILNTADQSINIDSISTREQRKMSGIFNNCIYEIDMELALTERQFERTPENIPCLNKVYEIRDALLELGTVAQQFSDLANNTDSDRVLISESYSKVLAEIAGKGKAAMQIRDDFCLKTN